MNFKCNICNIFYTSDILYQAHVYSSSHERNVKKFQNQGGNVRKSDECKCSTYIQKSEHGYGICTLCQVTLNSDLQVYNHVLGHKHRKLIPHACRSSGDICIDKTLATCKNISSTASNFEPQSLCVECKCIQKCKDGYLCTLCKVSLNSFQQVQAHVIGQKHLKLLPCKCSCDKVLATCKNIDNAVQVSSIQHESSDRVHLFPTALSSPAQNILFKVKFFSADDEVCF